MDSFKKYHRELLEVLERLPEQFSAMQEAADAIASAEQIFCVGIGKSSLVARKLAASLASVGLKAWFLHPAEALHGDIGIVDSGKATVVVFSKSGNSREVNDLLPFLRERRARIIAVCNRRDSALGRYAENMIELTVQSEGEPLNILPLISIDSSMVVANMIIAEVSQQLSLTMEAFAKNHPGGQLGRNVSLRIEDLSEWKERKPFVREKTTIRDAIVIDSTFHAGLVCVTTPSNALIGVMSDGDIRRALQLDHDIRELTTDSLMNKSPLVLKTNMLIGEALAFMEAPSKQVFSAPVVDDAGSCLGVVTLHDLIN